MKLGKSTIENCSSASLEESSTILHCGNSNICLLLFMVFSYLSIHLGLKVSEHHNYVAITVLVINKVI